MNNQMNIAKAYEMMISANTSRQPASGAARDMQEPWLSASIYRAVSRTSDLLDRLASRTLTRR